MKIRRLKKEDWDLHLLQWDQHGGAHKHGQALYHLLGRQLIWMNSIFPQQSHLIYKKIKEKKTIKATSDDSYLLFPFF